MIVNFFHKIIHNIHVFLVEKYMTLLNLKKISGRIDQEKEIFSNKSYFDSLIFPSQIVGREKEAQKVMKYLLGFKKGFVVPLISVHGRSGSGKSSVLRFISKNFKEISFCFVNLREGKTIFGAANLILKELHEKPITNSRGINDAFDRIKNGIRAKLKRERKNVFVLVLDEVDVIFNDKRGNPSDFIYKLITLEETLRNEGKLFSIISISNNIFRDFDLDDRVRSRIGSNEIFFKPYSKKEVIDILNHIAKKAFSAPVEREVINLIAVISSVEHGDARRAVDLLRKSAEISSSLSEKLSVSHVDRASFELQKDTIGEFLSSAPFHNRFLCVQIGVVSFVTGRQWHSTSSLYKFYAQQIRNKCKPLSYRRISELLGEIEQAGFLDSATRSYGRHGFGTQYRLKISPEMIIKYFPDVFEKCKKMKEDYYNLKNNPENKYVRDVGLKFDKYEAEKGWAEHFGWD